MKLSSEIVSTGIFEVGGKIKFSPPTFPVMNSCSLSTNRARPALLLGHLRFSTVLGCSQRSACGAIIGLVLANYGKFSKDFMVYSFEPLPLLVLTADMRNHPTLGGWGP